MSQKSVSAAQSAMNKTAMSAKSVSAAQSAVSAKSMLDKSATAKVEEGGYSVSLAPSRKDVSSKVDMDKSVAFTNTVMAGPSVIQQSSREGLSIRKSVAHARKGRRVFLMRNAERVDRIFPEWMSVAFVAGNKYRPYDMNLPLKLNPRAGFPESYRYDAPITELGAMTAQMIGRGFTANKLPAATILSSPALRCVQTASNIVKAMDNKLRMGIETALFDFPGWYEQVPIWMDDAEMNGIGIPVDGNYTPVETRDAIHEHKSEAYIDFQKRVAANINNLLERQKDTNNLVLVTHGTTMDAIARGLLGQEPVAMSAEQMNALGSMFPFCSLVVFEEQDGKWKMIDDAMPYITYLDFSNCPSIPYAAQ